MEGGGKEGWREREKNKKERDRKAETKTERDSERRRERKTFFKYSNQAVWSPADTNTCPSPFSLISFTLHRQLNILLALSFPPSPSLPPYLQPSLPPPLSLSIYGTLYDYIFSYLDSISCSLRLLIYFYASF